MNKDEMIKEIYETLSRVSQTARTFEEVAYRLYTENCRIIADDEMVIKKSEYDILLRDYALTYDNAYQWGLKVGEENTAIEILQELYDEAMNYTNEVVELTAYQIKQLAKEKGIELE